MEHIKHIKYISINNSRVTKHLKKGSVTELKTSETELKTNFK